MEQLNGSGWELFSADNDTQSAVLSLRSPRLDCEQAAALLSKADICVRAGLHCAPLAHESAGTLETGTVRLSLSPFLTSREVSIACSAIRALQ